MFERTFDSEFICRCLTSPEVWRMSCSDELRNIDPELFFINDKMPLYFLKAGDYGLLMGEPKGLNVYEVHVALLPEAKGSAIEICRDAIKWFFDNEDCDVITASIPAYNHLALRLAKYIGMESVGSREKAFIKDGVEYDLRLFEIRR